MNKIDLIIDALESAHHTNDTGVMGLTKLRLDTALAAARELKALKPVGIVYDHFGTTISPYNDGLFSRLEKYPNIKLQKLYALDDEVNHD